MVLFGSIAFNDGISKEKVVYFYSNATFFISIHIPLTILGCFSHTIATACLILMIGAPPCVGTVLSSGRGGKIKLENSIPRCYGIQLGFVEN